MSNKLSLPLTVVSPQDLEDVRVFLRSLVTSRRAHQVDRVEGNLPPDTLAWLQSLIQDESVEAVERAMHAIESSSHELPIIEVSVASILSSRARLNLIEWLRREISPGILIRQQIDRSLIGGIRLRTSRSVYDLSIADALNKSRTTLTETIHAWA